MMARRRDNAIGKEDAMSHDKIKIATRRRMSDTGEPYAVARNMVIRLEQAFGVVATQLARNGQVVRSQLTSSGGIDEIRQRFAALQWFRNLGHSVDDRPIAGTSRRRPQWQCQRCGSDLQLDHVGSWVSSSGVGRCPHEGASW